MPRHRVQVSIQPFPLHTLVVFIDRTTQQLVGPIVRFRSDELVMELLQRAHANLETLNWVERALVDRRPVMIDIDLDAEQYGRLTAPRPRLRRS